MSKTWKLLTVLILGAFILGGASLALAGGGLTGNWSGKWTCPQGEIKGGKLHGNLNQDGDKVKGQWTLEGTIKGTISGPLTGTAKGGMFIGDLNAGGARIHFDGHYTDRSIDGNYSSELGDGQFHLNRQ